LRILAEFIPGLGSVAIALSGITRVPPAVFMPFELVGASHTSTFPFFSAGYFTMR
jgi:membrane protein DedA with SNARE-associated domain